MIGSGATAVTLVPAIAADAGALNDPAASPSYVCKLPAIDKISGVLGRVLPDRWVMHARQHPDPALYLPAGGGPR